MNKTGCWAYVVVLVLLALPAICLFNTAAHLPAAGVAAETTNPIPGLTAAQTDGLWSLVLGAGILLAVAVIVRGVKNHRAPKEVAENSGPHYVRPMAGGEIEPWAANVTLGETTPRPGTRRPAYRLDLFSITPEQDAIDRATPITEMSVDLRSENRQ